MFSDPLKHFYYFVGFELCSMCFTALFLPFPLEEIVRKRLKVNSWLGMCRTMMFPLG